MLLEFSPETTQTQLENEIVEYLLSCIASGQYTREQAYEAIYVIFTECYAKSHSLTGEEVVEASKRIRDAIFQASLNNPKYGFGYNTRKHEGFIKNE
jgi:hypothetical protein